MSGTFLGIDLASQPRRTGMAILRADADRIVIDDVVVGVTDDDIHRVLPMVDKAGIDVPLGWPVAFAELVAAHERGELVVTDPLAWRRDAVLRATDHHVRELTGTAPLSVAADRIAYPALRWATIEASLRADDVAVDRSGRDGIVCEVYPTAALRMWGLPHRSYKGGAHRHEREHLVRDLSGLMPELEWGRHRDVCSRDDNALDAVLAALVARDVHRGRAYGPVDAQVGLARREGWIWIPAARSRPSS